MALTDKEQNMAENNEITRQIEAENKEMENTIANEETQLFDGDIDLSVTRKKRFRVDRNNNKYLELNTSDMGIITRLDNLYPKLEKLSQDAAIKKLAQEEEDDEKTLTKISNALIKIDVEMRKIIDDIFDSNVCEVCAPDGSMIDPFNGEFRFEHILDVLTKLYENNLNTEYKKMSDRIKKRTSKYTKGK